MSGKTRWLIIAVLIGAVVVLWQWWYTPSPPETKRTDAALEEALHENEVLKQRLKERDAELRKRVVTVRDETQKQVATLAPDSVADGLNDELDRWRGVEVHPEGLDDPRGWVLGH